MVGIPFEGENGFYPSSTPNRPLSFTTFPKLYERSFDPYSVYLAPAAIPSSVRTKNS